MKATSDRTSDSNGSLREYSKHFFNANSETVKAEACAQNSNTGIVVSHVKIRHIRKACEFAFLRGDVVMIHGRASKSHPVGVISKVFHILEVLESSPAGLRLQEISIQTQINKSTAYRLLTHMESEGYLFRDESGAYLIGPRFLRLGSGPAYHMTLRKISRPVLQILRDTTGETVNLGILVGQDVFYVDVVQSRHSFRMASRIGMFRPLYCTAMGKTLACMVPPVERERLLSSLQFRPRTLNTITQLSKFKAELLEVRERGYAVDHEEAELGARCISAPIAIYGGKLAAAISVSGPTVRMPRESTRSFANAVQSAALTIATRLDKSGQ
jgi:DNA-binding IclR family transcriptional regulator